MIWQDWKLSAICISLNMGSALKSDGDGEHRACAYLGFEWVGAYPPGGEA